MLTALVWNILFSIVAAATVACLCRSPVLLRRPALRQTLWLLVLVTLVTPPLIPVPLLPPPQQPYFDTGNSAAQETPESPEQQLVIVLPSSDENPSVLRDSTGRDGTHERGNLAWPRSWSALGVAISLTVSCLLLAWSLMRTWRFTRWLDRFGHQNRRLADICGAVSLKMGVHRPVTTLTVDARFAPMYWGWMHGRIIVPRSIAIAGSDTELRCIVAHELAHCARHDQWTRLMVRLFRAVFWWNPITWWAEREIRDAQEACCDAIAISCTGTHRQEYATTLLNALDFLQPNSRVNWGPALHMGTRKSILRRFEMIGNKHLTHQPTWGVSFVLACAIIPLSLCIPVRSQETEQTSTAKPTAEVSSQAAKKSHKFVAENPKQVVLAGITGMGTGGDKSSAWITDRAARTNATVIVGDSFKVAGDIARLTGIESRAVRVLVDDKEYEWKLGECFRDRAPKVSENSARGKVTIETTDDPDVVILRGDKEEIKKITDLIRKMESSPKPERGLERNNEAESPKLVLMAYRPDEMAADVVLEIIRAVIGGRPDARAEMDKENRTVVVLANVEDHQRIAQLLKKLAAPLTRNERKLKFDFRYQPWEDVVKWYANAARLSLVTDTGIPGTFNYQDERLYTEREVLSILNRVLLPKDRLLLVRDRTLHVIDVSEGISKDLVPHVSLDELNNRDTYDVGNYEFVRVMIPVGRGDIEQVREEILPLLSSHGRAVAMPKSRQLLITDRAGVVRQVQTHIALLEAMRSIDVDEPLPKVDLEKLLQEARESADKSNNKDPN